MLVSFQRFTKLEIIMAFSLYCRILWFTFWAKYKNKDKSVWYKKHGRWCCCIR